MARGNLNPDHPGTNSPLYKAEKAFVVICIQMGKIRQPLTGPEAIRLFNNMIKNTPIQMALNEFQMVWRLDSDSFGPARLGW